jgi:hypothetical protein
LVLKIGDEAEYRFKDIALAQGSTAGSNNWWFGGKTCSNIGGNQVSCQGIDKRGEKYKFVFLRGGNNTSEVVIVSIQEE